MEKLLNSRRARCLSTLTVSRRMGPQNPEKLAGCLCRTVLHTSFHLPAPRASPFIGTPLLPAHQGNVGAAKAKPLRRAESNGNRRGSDRLEAPPHSVLSVAWPQDGKLVAH